MFATERRIRRLGACLLCFVAGWTPIATGQETTASADVDAREIPWRRDVGQGRESGPGRSQRLPPVDGRPNNDVAPEKWWKEDAEDTVYGASPGDKSRGVSARGEIIQSTQILSWVGGEPILAGDLLGRINEMLAGAAGKVPESELEKQRWLLMQRLLPSAIESKLVYVDFTKRMEAAQIQAIRDSVYEQFDERQLPRLIEQAKVDTAAELEQRLRTFGTSIANVRRSFFEQVAAREMIRKQSDDDAEVTHDELLAHYRDHADEFAFESRARWEQLTARFDEHESKSKAYSAIVRMGNAVLRGAKLHDVARRYSDGVTAEDGGQFDWTTKGSLVSEVIDEQIFSLPPGVLSDILEDEIGFHIVRVIERKEAGHVPFLEAQVTIREQIKEARRDAKVKEYLQRLKTQTYVWDFFEDGTQVAGRQADEPLR